MLRRKRLAPSRLALAAASCGLAASYVSAEVTPSLASMFKPVSFTEAQAQQGRALYDGNCVLISTES